MYTSGNPKKPVPARGCTRSRDVQYAGEDLEFLNQYAAARTRTHIKGIVQFRPDVDRSEEDRTPLKNVEVSFLGDAAPLRTTTTASGEFAIWDVPAQEHTLSAELPGYSVDWAPETIKVEAGGCVDVHVLMKVDRRVQGTILDENSVPLAGALVEMMSTDGGDGDFLLDVSDEQGRYVIKGIPPGQYYLGVNIQSTPTKQYPFPPTFYPGTSGRDEATTVRVRPGASVQDFNLRVPYRLSLVKLHGKVQTADGRPPAPEDNPHVRIKNPRLRGQIEEEEITIDSEGRFEFELCEGVAYSAFAFSGRPPSTKYSEPVEFVPTKSNDSIVLTLKQDWAEFHSLRPK